MTQTHLIYFSFYKNNFTSNKINTLKRFIKFGSNIIVAKWSLIPKILKKKIHERFYARMWVDLLINHIREELQAGLIKNLVGQHREKSTPKKEKLIKRRWIYNVMHLANLLFYAWE